MVEQDLFKLNKRIFADFITAQQVLSKSMGVYGTRSQALAQLGILEAEKIITWVEKSLAKRQKGAEMPLMICRPITKLIKRK